MAYSGYLIKVGTYSIPAKYIKFNSYSVTYSTNDLDSYRDSDGLLHRNALADKKVKIEFETPPMLTNSDLAVLMANISSNYINATEKSATVTAYIPETDTYVSQKMYIPDIKVSIYGAYNNQLHYNPIRFAFIGY